MSDEAVRRGHVGFWLNKHFRLYGECHAAPIKRLGEALLLLESWGGVLELACFVIINQLCLFFFLPSELLFRKEKVGEAEPAARCSEWVCASVSPSLVEGALQPLPAQEAAKIICYHIA